jgi:hypothetical protein
VQHIVIALFDHEAQARSAADALVRQGFDRASVQVTGASGDPHENEPLPPAAAIEGGPASGLLHRLALLFGVDDEPHVVHYEEAVRRGGSLVRVEVDGEDRATAARDALLALGAVNIDDRVEEWREAGWDDAGRKAPTVRGVAVHRHEVSIGGVRVYGQTAVRAFEDDAAAFRADFESRYAPHGDRWDEFDPAYRFGHGLAADTRYRDLDWDAIEPEVRLDWQQRHPARPWERFKRAVQHAWEKASGRLR